MTSFYLRPKEDQSNQVKRQQAFSLFLAGGEEPLLFMQQPAEKLPLHNDHNCITFIYKAEHALVFKFGGFLY